MTRNPRFWPLAVFILLPVLVLAGVAAYGLKSLEKNQQDEERAKLKLALATVVEVLQARLLEALAKSPPVFLPPAAPVPGESNEAADVLAELAEAAATLADAEEADPGNYYSTWFGLCALRDKDSLSDTFTPSGLPVRTMAAWHAWNLTGGQEDAEALTRLAMEVPCLLSEAFVTRMLERAEEVTPDADWIAPLRRAWQTSQERQWIIQPREEDDTTAIIDPLDHVGVAPGEFFLRLRGGTSMYRDPDGKLGLWLVDRADDAEDTTISRDAIRTLSPEELQQIASRVFAHYAYLLPAWAAFRCPNLEEPDPEKQAWKFGNPLVDTETNFVTVPPFGIYVVDQNAWNVVSRTIRSWAIAVIGSALVTALLGLWLVRRTLEKERRLGELKSQFVSSVSHELRAPVGSLRLMADGLASGKVTGAAAAEFHRLMAGEGARLSSLIENVLDFARIEQGRKEYHMAETDIHALVQDAVKLMTPQAEARGLRIVCEMDRATLIPRVDAGALQQALINLLDNAVKFSPEDAEVRVALSADRSRNTWSLTVTDHGPGIPQEEHLRIFERFYRLGNELRRETTGTGIGLAIVKHIVEGHGGRVLVVSAPGQGSAFRMEFPSAPSDLSDASTPSVP